MPDGAPSSPTPPHTTPPRPTTHHTTTQHTTPPGPPLQVVENHKVNETYVLFQCGAPTPDFTAFPEGAKFFQVRAL